MNQYKSVWLIPLILIISMVAMLSLRKLSDPDIGSHLKAGQWIIQHKAFPQKDTFTYTVNSHDYIDMNWIFQVFVYSIYSVTGYNGLSILVMMSLLGLLFLFLFMHRQKKIPVGLTAFVLLIGFLVLEMRISLRPEIFTFLFLVSYIIILEEYYYNHRKILFLLPLIMLIWCNMHGLFILGFVLIGAWSFSLIIRDRKIDKPLILWTLLSIAACFLNPYFVKGIAFPLELFTRFDAGNIFHSHIKELKSFYSLDKFFLKDVLFLIFMALVFISCIFTWRRRRFHELILVLVFAYLALVSVRNIALFAIIGMPVLSIALNDLVHFLKGKNYTGLMIRLKKPARISGLILMIVIPLGLMARICTGAFYADNHEYTKFGVGTDTRQCPEKAASFMIQNRLTGRIINGISLGGWLSWRLAQPVFIDGRLEVMKEDFYEELTKSWKDGLNELAGKYNADLIIFNYVKYYPWTVQLAGMHNWRVIYLDGLTAIFARSGYHENISPLNQDSLLQKYCPGQVRDDKAINDILRENPEGSWSTFLDGFWKKTDLASDDLLNIGSFYLQLKQYPVAAGFLLENLQRTHGRNRFIFYALGDIYTANGDLEKASICYQQVLKFDPGNVNVKRNLEMHGEEQSSAIPAIQGIGTDAIRCFNEANDKVKRRDFRGAMQLYDQAIKLSPMYSKALNNRAIVKATALRNYKDAIKDFSRAIEINPGYADAFLGRGASKLELGDVDGACSDLQKAMKLGSEKARELISRVCKGK